MTSVIWWTTAEPLRSCPRSSPRPFGGRSPNDRGHHRGHDADVIDDVWWIKMHQNHCAKRRSYVLFCKERPNYIEIMKEADELLFFLNLVIKFYTAVIVILWRDYVVARGAISSFSYPSGNLRPPLSCKSKLLRLDFLDWPSHEHIFSICTPRVSDLNK